ncbi:Ras guanine nucleotide exchange factor [Heterostelium album PN500]|uniref:Ras guanine nucleotide exchange factor n=1 Tax=Heterostelium pallidum (strain ATCC 26659 / Pp 5 / PN500) TaxID=670386 RepID=D3BRJ5_HETP5|nr:Ras guanine nucleotide exchange factor [Heterostelium album PN500]EFA76027.1 Ras guanine nucleotide exchange factor [Heterostelium album PN500]|eukprot:XP_020428161.1 Ras guanine nucleotide exchange factor [Heterostelium album PN500]
MECDEVSGLLDIPTSDSIPIPPPPPPLSYSHYTFKNKIINKMMLDLNTTDNNNSNNNDSNNNSDTNSSDGEFSNLSDEHQIQLKRYHRTISMHTLSGSPTSFIAPTPNNHQPTYYYFNINKIEYSLQTEKQVIDWIYKLTNTKINPPICESLKSGVILCKLLNTIKPNYVKKINTTVQSQFAHRENLLSFCKGCETLGFPEDVSRVPELVLEGKDIIVVKILFALMKFMEKSNSNNSSSSSVSSPLSTSPTSPYSKPNQPISPVQPKRVGPSVSEINLHNNHNNNHNSQLSSSGNHYHNNQNGHHTISSSSPSKPRFNNKPPTSEQIASALSSGSGQSTARSPPTSPRREPLSPPPENKIPDLSLSNPPNNRPPLPPRNASHNGIANHSLAAPIIQPRNEENNHNNHINHNHNNHNHNNHNHNHNHNHNNHNHNHHNSVITTPLHQQQTISQPLSTSTSSSSSPHLTTITVAEDREKDRDNMNNSSDSVGSDKPSLNRSTSNQSNQVSQIGFPSGNGNDSSPPGSISQGMTIPGKKPRSSTKQRIEKFFSKTSLVSKSSRQIPMSTSPNAYGGPNSPTSAPSMSGSGGGFMIKKEKDKDKKNKAMADIEIEVDNDGYYNNGQSAMQSSGGYTAETYEEDGGIDDGAALTQELSQEELMKNIKQIEFLYKDRKILKERINFTYPEKYRSFVAYDALLQQEKSPTFVNSAFLALSPKAQAEVCRREERRMLSDIFTLKNVLNVVEENKALVIRAEEMQKMVDQLIVEKKALNARFDEMLASKSKAEASRVEEEGIIFSEVNGKFETIKGGNTDKLIERLYNKNIIGSVSDYVDTFLLTYRSFTTSKYVLERLTKTYNDNSATEDGAGADSESQFIVEQENLGKKKIRLRICNFLKRWVDVFFHDFDNELLQEYNVFISKCKDEKLNNLLRRTLEKKLSGASSTKTATFGVPPPPVIPPKTPILSIDDIDPVEMARQLTIIEFDMYRQIASKELLSLSWQKNDKETRSPNLLKMIHRFNEVSNWVVTKGNPDKLENGFVNFFKCRMVAEVIKEIQQYQQQPYNLAPVPEIATYLQTHKNVSESDCFKLSLTAEPRESIST